MQQQLTNQALESLSLLARRFDREADKLDATFVGAGDYERLGTKFGPNQVSASRYWRDRAEDVRKCADDLRREMSLPVEVPEPVLTRRINPLVIAAIVVAGVVLGAVLAVGL